MENYKFSTLPYQRPDLEARRAQLARWQDAVEQAESFDALRALLFEMDRANGELSTQCAIAHIRHTLDTRDAFYEAEIHYLQDTLPTLGAAEVALSEAIASSPFRPDIEREFGKQYFVAIDLQKKQFCEANVPLRQQESRLTNEYQKIMAAAEIPFDGKTLNLYGVQKYFEHPDRAVRAAAVKAYSAFYEANEPRLEEIWDELIRIRNQMGKNLGYENYIPLGYLEQGRTDYGEPPSVSRCAPSSFRCVRSSMTRRPSVLASTMSCGTMRKWCSPTATPSPPAMQNSWSRPPGRCTTRSVPRPASLSTS